VACAYTVPDPEKLPDAIYEDKVKFKKPVLPGDNS
jgi:acyl dehydratase